MTVKLYRIDAAAPVKDHVVRFERGVRSFLLFLCCTAMVVALPTSYAAARDRSTAEEVVISLEARTEPLGRVLERIQQETGYRFILDPSWKDHPVTVSFRGLPLGQGLKRVLANLNHAVVYQSEREIRIIIFGEAAFQPAGSFPVPRPAPPVPPREEEIVDDVEEVLDEPSVDPPPLDQIPEGRKQFEARQNGEEDEPDNLE